MSNTDREPCTEYSLLDFAAEFDGERAEEHREAIKEAEKAGDDPHGE